MIGLFVLVLLLAAFYGGARRGTSLQLVSVLGYLISFFFAVANYQEIAKKIELYVPYMSVTADSKLKYYDMELALDLDKAYYAAIAFVMVLFAGWLITKLVVIFADSLRYKRLRFLGGSCGCFECYLDVYQFVHVFHDSLNDPVCHDSKSV